MSPERIIYKFVIFNYVLLVAQIGGLAKSIIFTCGLLVYLLNERTMIFKQIRNMYFVKKASKRRSISDYDFNDVFYQKLRIVKPGFWERATNLRLICFRRRNNKDCNPIEKTINIGETKLQNESNIFAILQSIQKLKSSVSLLVGDDQKLTEKIRKLYINN